MAPRLELFPFRHRDPVTGTRVRARYHAELHAIAKRHVEYENIGPPEILDVDADARYFNPTRGERRAASSFGNLGPILSIAGGRQSRRVAIAESAT